MMMEKLNESHSNDIFKLNGRSICIIIIWVYYWHFATRYTHKLLLLFDICSDMLVSCVCQAIKHEKCNSAAFGQNEQK